jgi:hypothetical protein
VRKLLEDPEPLVRLRVALVAATRNDKEAVPVLIALVSELPLEKVGLVEDCLLRLAGDKAPEAPKPGDPAARRLYRDAWSAWWREHGNGVDLAANLDPQRRLLAGTLIAQIDGDRIGQVLELGADGKPAWSIGNLQFPVDVQVLPGKRLLIAEYVETKITERDFKGRVLSQKYLSSAPVNVQRLDNGNTFIATKAQLLEVDPAGKEVSIITQANPATQAACKLASGEIVVVTAAGRCLRLDAAGKELKNFPVGNIPFGGLDVLTNGRILVAQEDRGKVVEYDVEGKVVWEAAVAAPRSATRLPNGRTLVASLNGQRVVEIDRAGKVVWEYKGNLRPCRARRY